MKVFYYCQTGVHTALIAGYLHLGLLPQDFIPHSKTFIQLKGFDSFKRNEIGKIIYLGTAKEGAEIYCFGVLNERQLGPRAVKSLLTLNGLKDQQYMLIDTFECINSWIRMGTNLKLVLGTDSLAAKLICYGLQKNYFKIGKLVNTKKTKLMAMAEDL